MRSNEILMNMRSVARDNGLTKTSIAKMAGLGDTSLRDFWKPSWNPTLKMFQKVEEVINRVERVEKIKPRIDWEAHGGRS